MQSIAKGIFISSLFSELEILGVDYFVMGEYKHLPDDTCGSDIDIVVDGVKPSWLRWHIAAFAKKCGVILASYYRNKNAELFRFITQDWGVQIDFLINGLFYRGVQYFPIVNLKNHIILHNGIRVLEQQYGFYVDFFKEIIHNGCAKPKYCEALIKYVSDCEEQAHAEIIACYSTQVWTLIQQNLSVTKLNEKGLDIRRAALQSFSKCEIVSQKIIYSFMQLGRLTQSSPGYVIAVEGTDGSGKSAIINSVTPWLNECFHNSVRYNHLRPHLMPDIGVILGKRKDDGQVAVVDNPHSQKPSGFIGSLVRWIYYLHDYTWGYLAKVWTKIRTRSYVFVFDRYYYDYYIDSIRSRTILPHWFLRIGEIFVPKPDVILCLGGAPEMIYARKPETSLEEVTRQTDELKRFATRRKNAVWINTTQPIENSIRDAKTAILKMMSTRFKDVCSYNCTKMS